MVNKMVSKRCSTCETTTCTCCGDNWSQCEICDFWFCGVCQRESVEMNYPTICKACWVKNENKSLKKVFGDG